MLLELLFGANARAVQNIRAAVRSAADNDLSLRVNMARLPIAVHHRGSDGLQLSVDLLDEDLVDRGIDHEGYVLSMVFLCDVIGGRCAQPLVHRSRDMATSMRRLPGSEHVVDQRQTLRDEGLHEEVPNRGQIMGLGAQGTIVTVCLFCSFEPWLGVKGLRLIKSLS